MAVFVNDLADFYTALWTLPKPVAPDRVGAFLPDDHPHWLSHSRPEGHTDFAEWTVDDQRLARDYYRCISGKARPFFDVLLDHPSHRISADHFVATAPETLPAAVASRRRSTDYTS